MAQPADQLPKAILAHKRALAARMKRAARGLRAVAREAKGQWIGPEFVADLADTYGEPAGYESGAALARRAGQIRRNPALADTARLIQTMLARGAERRIDALQRDVYARDQAERARMYDRVTNPAWRIEANVTDDELATLADLPIEGRTRSEWIQAAAHEWAMAFRAAVVRSLASTQGGFKTGLRAMARAINATFDAWHQRAARLAELAGLVAMHASAREFRRAFIAPAARVA